MSIRIHLDEIADLDPADKRLKKTRVIMPKPQKQSSLEETMLESALRIFSTIDFPLSPLVGDCLDFKSNPKRDIKPLGALKHMTVRPHASPIKTVAVGPSGSAGLGVSLGISAGFFFASTSPHVGLYGSIDVGVITNATASVVVQLMLCWAPQNLVFNGPPVILIGVNVSIPGGSATAGGFIMCFERIPNPLEVFGVGFQAGVGMSVLPVDLFMSKSFGKSTV